MKSETENETHEQFMARIRAMSSAVKTDATPASSLNGWSAPLERGDNRAVNASERHRRIQKVSELHSAGLNTAKIAKEVGINQKTVRRDLALNQTNGKY